MRKIIVALLPLLLVSCAAVRSGDEPAPDASTEPTDEAGGSKSDLPDLGPAPELENEVWLNVDAPLRLSDLRGQVVLIDMWTYG